MGACQLEPRDGKPPADAASTDDDLFGIEPQPALGEDGVGIGEACRPDVLVNGHSERVDLLAQGRMRNYISNHLPHACQQPGIVESRLAHDDTVSAQLPSFANKPGGMSERPHRNRSVIGSHASKCIAAYQHGARAQVRCPESRQRSRRSSAYHQHVCHRGARSLRHLSRGAATMSPA